MFDILIELFNHVVLQKLYICLIQIVKGCYYSIFTSPLYENWKLLNLVSKF